jgi:cleavage and polyadenylation specificity factor subunit 3
MGGAEPGGGKAGGGKQQPAPAPARSEDDTVEIIPLGAGQEVGRSCIIVRYMGKRVMLDCGIHPGFAGQASLPFLDAVDLSEVDVMLVTHFHLDHCAAVPYVVGHTNFKGRIFMTHPTKAIVHTLLKDFVKVSRGAAGAGACQRGGADSRAAALQGDAPSPLSVDPPA